MHRTYGLLCVLCDSLALSAVKFFTAKFAQNCAENAKPLKPSSFSQSLIHAAVDQNSLAGHIRRSLRCQPHDGVG